MMQVGAVPEIRGVVLWEVIGYSLALVHHNHLQCLQPQIEVTTTAPNEYFMAAILTGQPFQWNETYQDASNLIPTSTLPPEHFGIV